MSKLEGKIDSLEERVQLLTGMVLGLNDRISDMDKQFVRSIMEAIDLVTSLPGKKTPKASQGGSSVRNNTPCKKRQSNPHAGSSRSSRKKG